MTLSYILKDWRSIFTSAEHVRFHWYPYIDKCVIWRANRTTEVNGSIIDKTSYSAMTQPFGLTCFRKRTPHLFHPLSLVLRMTWHLIDSMNFYCTSLLGNPLSCQQSLLGILNDFVPNPRKRLVQAIKYSILIAYFLNG